VQLSTSTGCYTVWVGEYIVPLSTSTVTGIFLCVCVCVCVKHTVNGEGIYAASLCMCMEGEEEGGGSIVLYCNPIKSKTHLGRNYEYILE